LRWSIAAANDLEDIANYLYLYHPDFAVATIHRLYGAAKSLKEFPYVGRVAVRAAHSNWFSPRFLIF
jgi:plasmid stabilization system protein ParE